jgi:D-glycerate 3-kinase
LAPALAAEGETCVVLGLDDYYLSKAARLALAEGVHPLFATRGPPGTHDLTALNAALDALMAGDGARLRRFDKGADDIVPEREWPLAPPNAGIVILEGWCVGAVAQPDDTLAAPINALETAEDASGVWRSAVNAALAGPYRALFARLDRLILLRPPSFEVVLGWRAEQEATTAARAAREGRAAPALMDHAALVRFVQHYERVTQAILLDMPARADLTVRLDNQRRPVG